MQNEETPIITEPIEETKKATKKRPPEKRLFHQPITPIKVILYALLAVLAAALVLVGRFIFVTVIDARAAFPDATLSPAASAAASDSSENEQAAATAVPTPTFSPEELLAMQIDADFMKDRVNILLTGIDYSEEREGRADFRTDTIMMFSVNFSTGDVDILSVPRDSYADIAFTDRSWKINGAFMSAGGAEGDGFKCLMQTVSDTIGGIPVNYYVAVEMQAVKDIVDIIGGVWYDVDYEIDMNGRHLDIGYQLLDGQAVLDYCRARKGITSGTDIDRIDRQQRLLMEVFNQIKSADLLTEIPQIYTTMKDDIYTNLNFDQIASLAFFALDLDLENDLNRYTLKGEYMDVYHSKYYVLDHNYTVDVISDIFDTDVDGSINWSYSLKQVQKAMARLALDEAVTQVQDYLNLHRDMLSADLITQAENMIAATGGLSETDEMNEAAAQLNAFFTLLESYVPPTPAPTVPPVPDPTAAPEPTVDPALPPEAPTAVP